MKGEGGGGGAGGAMLDTDFAPAPRTLVTEPGGGGKGGAGSHARRGGGGDGGEACVESWDVDLAPAANIHVDLAAATHVHIHADSANRAMYPYPTQVKHQVVHSQTCAHRARALGGVALNRIVYQEARLQPCIRQKKQE
jgi:hypothetical protein